MKICIYSHYFYPSIGGVETSTRVLAEHIAKKGIEVTVITKTENKNGSKDAFEFEVIRKPSFVKMIRIIKNSNIIHMNGFNWQIFTLCKFLRKKIIWDHRDHDTVCPKAIGWKEGENCKFELIKCLKCLNKDHSLFLTTGLNLMMYLKKYASKKVDINLVHSDYMAHRLALPNTKVLCNAMDLKKFEGEDVEKKSGRVLFVGRLIKEKGCEVLIKAIKKCNEQGLKLTLDVCGDGWYRHSLEDLVKRLNISMSVNFLGNVTGQKLIKAYKQSLIVVVPSLWGEPFGLIPIEAMACKTAVIVSEAGGLPEVVGNRGVIFRTGNVDELSKKIMNLVGDLKTREKLEKLGYERVIKLFDANTITNEYVKLINHLDQTKYNMNNSLPSSYYNLEYYLNRCGGHEVYISSRGENMDLVHQKILDFVEIREGLNILDIGCGRGELVYYFAKKGCNVVGLDYSKDAIKLAKKTVDKLPETQQESVHLKCIDIKEMHFEKEQFDIIFCINVVEHLYDWEIDIVLSKCRDYLKNDGKLVIHTAPTINYLRYGQWFNMIWLLLTSRRLLNRINFEQQKRESMHINIQSREKLKRILQKNGFNAEVWYYFIGEESKVKKIIKNTFLKDKLAHNLFAIATPIK